ncbi:acid phosphatase [Sphingobium boeckii]|uniref:Acid phosphatase n=1 Tax=Sphingobium boeckii TaxID=1082345 RepID=A0A7W9EGH3_9SPHN|nr:phosphatase PAP2 family protein [Sphingobium boeckii]MBB5686721.1 acid phosphatase (class A) [Sphingobium boeckii]
MRFVFALCCLFSAACHTAAAAAPAPPMAAPRLGEGYLKGAAMTDSIALSPPPPAAGSAAEARDIEASKAGLALSGSPRWALATADADLFGPQATATLSCAAGVAIGPKTTPRLDRLLRKTIADLGMSTSAIKRAYQRPRPFMVNGQPTCTPDWEPVLRKDGSYPSGHSAIGYGWSLIVAELRPERAAKIVARGRAFGDSRRICNAHWLSDVEEGRIAAAATFARLNADPVFQKDIKAARAELKKAKASPEGCDSEAQTLGAP